LSARTSQRGATLIVALIMLALITVLVTSAFTMSSTNAKAVGNMQFRDEAVAAANKAIEQVLSSPFTSSPAGQEINVDLNNDDAVDYVVAFDAPTCVRESRLVVGGAAPSSVSLGSSFTSSATTFYETVWDLSARVHGADNPAGVSIHVRQGVRVLLTQAQFNAVCT
jgi:type II secretory pathway pseudopilin PulG